MCGRYAYLPAVDPAELIEQFSIHGDPPDVTPRYNVAPTHDVPVILSSRDDERHAQLMRWGLIPSWSSQDAARATGHINARGETLAEKPAFRRLLSTRRCLVLATGFYEWRRDGRQRTPFFFSRGGDTDAARGPSAMLAFAGLYDRWHGTDGRRVASCTIVTTQANGLVAGLHDRMPVVLSGGAIDLWLDRSVADPRLLTSALLPATDSHLQMRQVSTAVNSVGNDGPKCILPPLPGELQEWRQAGLEF